MAITINDVERNLSASQKDGNWNAVATGLTASYTTPFALALGASNPLIAFLASFPDLIGSASQLFSSGILRIISNRKGIVWTIGFAQALLWLSFLGLPLLSPASQTSTLAGLIIINAILAGLQFPIWNSLMGDIVPANRRGYFFARRTRTIGLCSFGAMLIAGTFLASWNKGKIWGFAFLFSASALARLASVWYKRAMTEVPADRSRQPDITLIGFAHKLAKRSTFGRFVLYASSMKFAVSIANPFFAVYMLTQLKLSYLQFTFVAAAPVIGRYLFTPLWGSFVDARGNKLVLVISGICAPLVPLLWLFSTKVPFLFLIELFSGFVWSGFDLSSGNYIFDAIKPNHRVKAVAYYNTLVGIGIFGGASLGGFILPLLPPVFGSTFLSIFLVSVIVRAVAAILLLPTIHEARLIEVPMKGELFPLAIRPSESLDYNFIDAALPETLESDSMGKSSSPVKQKKPMPDWAHSAVGRAIISYNRETGKAKYGSTDQEVLDMIRLGRVRLPSTLETPNMQHNKHGGRGPGKAAPEKIHRRARSGYFKPS